MKFGLIIVFIVLMFCGTVFAEPANLGYQNNVVDEFFHANHYIKMVLDVCEDMDTYGNGACAKTSNAKRIIMFPPNRYENAYDHKSMYQQIVSGRGVYVGHDKWARSTGKDGSRQYQLVGQQDIEFTYVNDGISVHLEFDRLPNESDSEAPETLLFWGSRIVKDTREEPGHHVFKLIPEIKASFVTNDMVWQYFKRHPDVERLIVNECIGKGDMRAACNKLHRKSYVIEKALLEKAGKLTDDVPYNNKGYDYSKHVRVYKDNKRGYTVIVSDTGVEFVTETTSEYFDYIQGSYGIYDSGYEGSGKEDLYGPTSDKPIYKPHKRFKYYRISAN